MNDTKDKIRSLALEAIAAFASIGEMSKISEIMFQLNIEKEACDLVMQRLDQGHFPILNPDGTMELPYQDLYHNLNHDVDSVAHSMANQTQISVQNSNYQEQ